MAVRTATMNMNHIDLQPKLGKRIMRWREHQSVSRRQLAEAVGITHQSLKQIEDGDTVSPRVHGLLKIATYFGKSVGELLGDNLSENDILIKIPPDIHLTDAEKAQLKMRFDFELIILKNNRILHQGREINEVGQ